MTTKDVLALALEALLDQWDYTPPDEETSNTEDV